MHDSLVSRFLGQVTRTPHRSAVEDGTLQWSYEELYEKSAAVATFLLKHPAHHKRAVMLVGKTNYSVPAVLGTLMAGWSHMCIDEDAPPQTLKEMCERIGPDLALIADEGGEFTVAALNTVRATIPVYTVQTILDEDAGGLIPLQKIVGLCGRGEDTAFLIPTSGSTGKPKITVVSHRAFLNALTLRIADLPFAKTERVGILSRFAFVATWEILSSLYAGSTAILIPSEQYWDGDALNDCLARHTVTNMTCIPSALHIALEHFRGSCFAPSLQTVIFTGNAIPSQLVILLKDFLPPATSFYNEYAMTEAYYLLSSRVDLENPTGANHFTAPKENSPACLVPYNEGGVDRPDTFMMAAKKSVLFSGYLGEDETLNLPLNKDGLFETGDLFFKEGDVICYKGRAGRRINWCGWRIEPEEIERALLMNEQIAAARLYVDTTNDEYGDLICAVSSPLSLAELKKVVSEILAKQVSTSLAQYVQVVKKDHHMVAKHR